ncbi:probable protein phosphatase 2C BIPP2C1 [Humulus lupulus]|uniref:probable protein phosphatase 2C BIPP2C1 n=1 Tax=Humulus lupulus TaxID=3486 RepID=UPI002B416C7F|nr:probable protein phosphatase 2C BIPP2C1 [Humulus lupulus]
MAEFYPNPIRACRPLSSLFLHPRILFPKPSHHHTNFVGKSAVIRTLKQQTRFQILSKSEPEFGILSTEECSDGSVVFRFGIAKDDDGKSVSGVDIDKVIVDGGDADTEGLVNENGEQLSESLGPQSSLEQVQSHSEVRERSYPAQVSSEISSAVREDCSAAESLSNGVSGLSKSLVGEATFEIEITESSSVDEVSINSDEDVVVTRNTVPLVDVLDEEVHSDGEENTAQICEGEVLHGLVSSNLSSVDEVSLNDDENAVGARNNVPRVDVLKVEVHSHIEENTTQICEDEVINGLESSELDTTTEVFDDEDVVGARNTVPQVDVLKEEVHSHIEENTTQICEDVVLNGSTSSELDTTEKKSDDEVVVGARNIVPQVDVLNKEVHSPTEEITTQICENEVLNGLVSSELVTTTESDDHYTSPASNEESADVAVADLGTIGEDDVNLIEATIVSSAVQVQTSLDEESTLSALDENVGENKTETSLAIGFDVSSTNCEEERGSKLHSSNVAGELISDVVELHSTEEATAREEISTTGLVLSTGAALLTHPSKAFIGAEDAYFVASQNWLGVADGVGQWSLEGINDGIYARELMKNCERIVSDSKGTLVNKPEEVLVKSVAKTQLPGSSTILVAYFDGQTFRVANIGDSGFIIIRNGVVFKRASSMVHEFNFPLHIERGDNPTDLIEDYEIDLDEGDVIVTATDGLFDNLYEQEIASIVSRSLEAGSKPQDIAELLASRAQEVAQSSTPRTPFADAAKAAGYVGFTGGKLDDVIVIVSLVQNTIHLIE